MVESIADCRLPTIGVREDRGVIQGGGCIKGQAWGSVGRDSSRSLLLSVAKGSEWRRWVWRVRGGHSALQGCTLALMLLAFLASWRFRLRSLPTLCALSASLRLRGSSTDPNP